jgi:hypothetical protein
MSQADFSKLAFSIRELANKGPIGRSSIYNQIAAGRLRARKIGRRTVILDEDWRAFLASTPVMAPSNSAGELSSTAAAPRRRGRTPKVQVNAVTEQADATTTSAATTKIPTPGTQEKTEANS